MDMDLIETHDIVIIVLVVASSLSPPPPPLLHRGGNDYLIFSETFLGRMIPLEVRVDPYLSLFSSGKDEENNGLGTTERERRER